VIKQQTSVQKTICLPEIGSFDVVLRLKSSNEGELDYVSLWFLVSEEQAIELKVKMVYTLTGCMKQL
jgi:hypothetical protein